VDESLGLAIKEHLELQRRNRMLEPEMPLAHYREDSPNGNGNGNGHAPVVLEDTQEWQLPDRSAEPLFPPADVLWTGTPAFDWGD
jgi:hypothetical protein